MARIQIWREIGGYSLANRPWWDRSCRADDCYHGTGNWHGRAGSTFQHGDYEQQPFERGHEWNDAGPDCSGKDCSPAGQRPCHLYSQWTAIPAGARIGNRHRGDGESGGSGATINTSTNGIDFSQAYSAVPANYKMQFVACGSGGRQTPYEVRWNIQTISANTRLITVAARPLAAASSGGNANQALLFALPITLRTIGGI